MWTEQYKEKLFRKNEKKEEKQCVSVYEEEESNNTNLSANIR